MSGDMPVSVWQDWKIVEKIGEGSFGKVYKAEQEKDGKTFYSAIKIISIPGSKSEVDSVRSELRDEEAVRAYFRALVDECTEEVTMMIRLHGDSNIVSVEDCKVVDYLDEVGWDIFIRMEYLNGFTEYYSEHPLTEEDVIRLGIDICKALENCKKRNVIHRDIKSENIFRTESGEFKLGDFGIARQLERTMSALSKKGTFSYMAPEMYRGEQYDHRVDIYSLGIVLYKLRNKNRLPFINLNKQLITYRDKENALTRRMSGEKLSAPVEACDELAEIILKASEFHVEERYASASEMRRDLEALMEKKYPDLFYELLGTRSVENKKKPDIHLDTSEMKKKKETVPEEKKPVEKEVSKPEAKEQKKEPKKKKKKRTKPLIWAAVLIWEAVIATLLISVRMGILPFSKKEKPDTTIDTIKGKLEEVTRFSETNAYYVENPGVRRWDRDAGDHHVKITVFADYSEDGLNEEYYYLEEACIYVRTKAEDSEVNEYYYEENGTLVRWVDEKGNVHDSEKDNREFLDRGKHYWNRAIEERENMLYGVSD